MSNPPNLSQKQREAALLRAADARRVRAETKDSLRDGSVTFGELLKLADVNE